MIPTVTTHLRPLPRSRIAQLQHRRSSIRACIIRRLHRLRRLTARQRLRLHRLSSRYDRLLAGRPTPPTPAAVPLPLPTKIDLAA